MDNYSFYKRITKDEEIGKVTQDVVNNMEKYNINIENVEKIKKVVYEAEKNIKLYAHSGEIQVEIKDNLFKAKFKDNGPGIDNIGLACEDGFSTANEDIKKQGYGLGRGLSLIQENVDYIDIVSIPGVGTTLDVSIEMK